MCKLVRNKVDDDAFAKIKVSEKYLLVVHRGGGYVFHTAKLELRHDRLIVFVVGKRDARQLLIDADHFWSIAKGLRRRCLFAGIHVKTERNILVFVLDPGVFTDHE